jgi:hypothetical protein
MINKLKINLIILYIIYIKISKKETKNNLPKPEYDILIFESYKSFEGLEYF